MRVINPKKYVMPKHDHIQESKTGGGIKGWIDVDVFRKGKYLYTALVREVDVER